MFTLAQAEGIMAEALKSIMASGPLAIVMLGAIVTLWRDNVAMRAKLISIMERISRLPEDKT